MKTIRIKTRLKEILAVALAAAALLNPHRASADILFGWDANFETLFGPSPWAPTTVSPNVTVGGLTRGSGLVTNGAVSFAWGAGNWSTTTEAAGIAANQVVTFSVTPNPGYTLSFTNINVWNTRRSTNGPSAGTLAYSVDGGTTFTEIKTNTFTGTSTVNVGPYALANVAGLQNLTSATTVIFRIVNYGGTNPQPAGVWYIYDPSNTNDFEFRGRLISSGVAPTNLVITPSSLTTNAGANVSFTVVAGGDPATNYWYFVSGGVTNAVGVGTTNPVLTLSSVTAANAGQYYVVLSNAFGSATSSPVSLSVIDPYIVGQPSSTYGLLGQQAEFHVTATGSSLNYQWYYATPSGTIVSAVANAMNSYSTSVNSGVTTSTLLITGLTATDLTNYVVVVSNPVSGLSVTSSVASLVGVGSNEILTFWNFNGAGFTNNTITPSPFLGVGTAGGINIPPATSLYSYTGVLDGDDGMGANFPYGQGGTPFSSWGTGNPGYPAQGTSNKTVGVEFMTSTAGAQNIIITYDCRATGTSSDYERLQYTTNGGINWIDYPTATTFGVPTSIDTIVTAAGQGNSGFVANAWASFGPYNLSGFDGVDNNPMFGFRIMTEWESTGTYGASPNTNFYGVGNTYGTGGTLSYDVVAVSGTSITNNSLAPIVGPLTNVVVYDNSNITVNVPEFDSANPPSTLVNTASSLGNLVSNHTNPGQGAVNLGPGSFTFSGSGAGLTMKITPSLDSDGITPVLVTATDPATGLTSTAWFYLTVLALNPPPTNSLLGFAGTNMVINSILALPFKAIPVHPADSNLVTYAGTSANSLVLPSANITFVATTNTETPTAMFTATNGHLGAVPVSIAVSDNDPAEDRTTTANFIVQVVPNTNIVLIDYFNNDAELSTGGSLFNLSGGVWTHLSGNAGQMQVGTDIPGFVKLDSLNNTENLHAAFSTGVYSTNSAGVLYASFIVNMSASSPPTTNGSFFCCFHDGSTVASNANATQDVTCRVIAATNNAATNGNYRLFISNAGTDANSAQMFPEDLVPGVSYAVVAEIVASNNFSTLWVSPNNVSSPSVSDTTPVTTKYNVGAFELRESGTGAGTMYFSTLKVGTTFDSVFPSLNINVTGNNAVLTSSDPTLGIQVSTNSASGPYTDLAPGTPYTNSIGTNGAEYYRFGQ